MSQTDLIVTAASAGVVALLVLIAFLMGFRARASIDPDGLARQLATSEPNARIAETLIGADGRAALARLADGKLLVARVMADGVSLRAAPPGAVSLRLRKGRAVVAFADVGFPPLSLAMQGEPPAWLKALAEEKA